MSAPAPDRGPPPRRLDDSSVRILHWVAILWALAAIAGLVIATELSLLDYRPGGDSYEITQQQVLGVVYAVAVLVAWRWPIVAGGIAGFAAAALMVFAIRQLEPLYAFAVVLAFLMPGVVWVVLDVDRLRRPLALTALALIAVAVVAGAVVADRVYDDLFGPTHPASTVAAPAASGVEWVWSGGVSESSATIVARLSVEPERVRLAVSERSDLGRPRYSSPVVRGEDGRVRATVGGLEPDTAYHYALELDGRLQREHAGRFRTFPRGPASFTLVVAACARVGSNGAVFDRIREADPLLYLIAGDFHYANIAENDLEAYQEIYDHTLTLPAQAALYRQTPVSYVWDDHDFADNTADRESESRPAAMSAYRRNVPHYALASDEAPIYQAFSVGRARVIVTDARSARSPAGAPDDRSKTMLGAEQKAWLKRELLAARSAYPLIFWVNSVPWIAPQGPGRDDWGGYATERRELADFIASNAIAGLVMLSGDAHMLAIDDGSNSDYSSTGGAGFPVLHAGALDRPGSVKGGPYSEGTFPGGGQFGLVEVSDDGGREIDVALSGRNWEDEEVVSHRIAVPVGARR